MAGIAATYISATSFTVVGASTSEFNEGRRVKAICSAVNKYGTIVSSSYSDPNTTVNITNATLDSGLTVVFYGIAADEIGSLPKHDHSSDEGEGGTIPALGSQLSVGEYDIKFDSLLSTDGKYSGFTCDGVLGDTLAFGDLVYLNTTDQRWELTDANVEATSGNVRLAIVLASGVNGNTRLLLLCGFIRENDWNFTSYGQALFVSTTAGDMSQTAPSTTGDIVRVVGYAGTTADEIYFSPDNFWLEIT